MTPDEIRRSWDDDDTPRSVFPEPLAERLTRENKELRAENERLTASWFHERDYCRTCSGFACEYADKGMTRCPSWHCDCFIEQFPDSPRALHPEAFIVLDKHAGEQP